MNGEQIWLATAAGGAVALALVVACALLWRTTRRLGARIGELEAERRTPQPAARPAVAETSTYVITGLDGTDGTDAEKATEAEGVVPGRVDATLFADIVARESAIKAAGLAHGLRRALSAQTRNRIRFEMKREVKRSRKQRRADLKAALRDLQARERSDLVDQDGEDAA